MSDEESILQHHIEERRETLRARERGAKKALQTAVSVARELMPTGSDSAIATLAAAYLRHLDTYESDERLGEIRNAIEMNS